ncbi:MAG TPA: carbonic anhydrase [Saprospiraceae bacterium]|nr:carbonic anhydrase [Saprospiraceae bacterium]
MKETLLKMSHTSQIPEVYQNTPIGDLIEYHNLGKPFAQYQRAEMLIGMCMDNRKHLNIPDNFSYIIRSGGANLRYSEFRVSYAIGVGDVQHLALIGHNNCGMVNLMARKELFIDGLIRNAGWTKEEAEDHFYHYEPIHEIGNEVHFILSETKRLRLRYPKIMIAPFMYLVEDNLLYLVPEE